MSVKPLRDGGKVKKFIGVIVLSVALAGCVPVDAPQKQNPKRLGLAHGAVNPAVTQDNIDKTICKVGWTKTIRPSSSVTRKIKTQMIQRQHWEGPAILDHYIPLQGGGAPKDLRNFLLQTPEDSYKKDAVEDQMHDDICDGRFSLVEAQQAMAAGWENYESAVR